MLILDIVILSVDQNNLIVVVFDDSDGYGYVQNENPIDNDIAFVEILMYYIDGNDDNEINHHLQVIHQSLGRTFSSCQ